MAPPFLQIGLPTLSSQLMVRSRKLIEKRAIIIITITFFPTVKDYSLPKYIPLLDNIESDLAAKLYTLSNPKGSDQRSSKNWVKGRK